MKYWRHDRTAACDELVAELERAAPLGPAARACCCPARPVVTVVMPPTARRPRPVDLLLCGHHFRVSQDSLKAAGAAVYDQTGLLIMTGTSADTARLEPEARGFVRITPGQRAGTDDRADRYGP